MKRIGRNLQTINRWSVKIRCRYYFISSVVGLGELGKTETARKYVETHKNDYCHILWIDSETAKIYRTTFS